MCSTLGYISCLFIFLVLSLYVRTVLFQPLVLFPSHVKFIRGKFRDPVRLQVWIDYNFLARIEIKLRNYVVNTLDENKNIIGIL